MAQSQTALVNFEAALLLKQQHNSPKEEALRQWVVRELARYTPHERDEAIGQAIAYGFAKAPDECKVFVRTTIGTPIDRVAWDVNVTRETAYRWKWLGRRIILHELHSIIRAQQTK